MTKALDIAIEALEWIAQNAAATFIEERANEALKQIKDITNLPQAIDPTEQPKPPKEV